MAYETRVSTDDGTVYCRRCDTHHKPPTHPMPLGEWKTVEDKIRYTLMLGIGRLTEAMLMLRESGDEKLSKELEEDIKKFREKTGLINR
jgi:hypothetical protein